MKNTNNNPLHIRQGKDTKSDYAKQLYALLYDIPMSRRTAATKLGYEDQTYMVTQLIFDWIESGRAQVIGRVKCERSKRIVEAVSTNPELFKDKNEEQYKLELF